LRVGHKAKTESKLWSGWMVTVSHPAQDWASERAFKQQLKFSV
jgi:hypothetical protein